MNHEKRLTAEWLFGWHAALFPTGYSGLHKIRVAGWRDDRQGLMRVVCGPIGREKIHYEAPPPDRLDGEMENFFRWWEKSWNDMDGILRAGPFVVCPQLNHLGSHYASSSKGRN